MSKIKLTTFSLILIFIFGCGGTEAPQFPMEKRYWTPDDYNKVINVIEFKLQPKENMPTFRHPEFKPVMQKLVDPQNYVVVLNDEELGVRHRHTVGSDFFDSWSDLQDLYYERDRTDAFIFEEELLKIWQFGLGMQISYFDLGIRLVEESADDPDSYATRNRVKLTIGTITSNFMIYLDLIDQENVLTESGKSLFAAGIDKYFSELIQTFPQGDYRDLVKKIESMEKKSNSETIKKSLAGLKRKIADLKSSPA